MNNIIKKILKEALEGGTEGRVLSNKEIKLFKTINSKKKELGSKNKLIEYIQMMLKLMGKNTSEARFYYEVYTQNYRPEGDYENLTQENFKDLRAFKQRKTPNNTAWEFTTARIPFKGSNLEGEWDDNTRGEWYYVVKSYGWYPVYIYKNGQWYGVSNTYSSSTSKQMANSRPRIWNDNLKSEMVYLSPDEMKGILYGKSLEDIEGQRYDEFVSSKDSYDMEVSRTKTFGWGNDKIKASFKIDKVDIEGDDVIFNIQIKKAGNVEGTNKMVQFTDGYPEDFKKKLDEYLTQYINQLFGQKLRRKNIVVKVTY